MFGFVSEPSHIERVFDTFSTAYSMISNSCTDISIIFWKVVKSCGMHFERWESDLPGIMQQIISRTRDKR